MADTSRGRPERPRGVSLRAVLIGLVATPINIYWMTYTYWRYGYGVGPGIIFYNAVCYLVALVGLNALLRRWRPRAVFSGGELRTIYVLLSNSPA